MVATTAWGPGPAIQGAYRPPFRGRGRNDMVFTDLALEDVGNTCEEEDKMEEVQFHFEMETEFDGDPTNTAVFWA